MIQTIKTDLFPSHLQASSGAPMVGRLAPDNPAVPGIPPPPPGSPIPWTPRLGMVTDPPGAALSRTPPDAIMDTPSPTDVGDNSIPNEGTENTNG